RRGALVIVTYCIRNDNSGSRGGGRGSRCECSSDPHTVLTFLGAAGELVQQRAPFTESAKRTHDAASVFTLDKYITQPPSLERRQNRLFSAKGLLLDRTSDRAQMLSERDACVRASGSQVLIEAGLLPKVGAELHACRLVAFGIANCGGQFGHLTGLAQ